MCFQEFIGYTCGHCSLAVLRPCPLTTASALHPVCSQTASKPFLTGEMCPACQRIVHMRATLIEEYEHRFMHERGVCGCDVDFPNLVRPRVVGLDNPELLGRGKTKDDVVPPLYQESVGEDGKLQVSVRLSSLFASEWVEDHRKRHEAGQCHCRADFRMYQEVRAGSQMANAEEAALEDQAGPSSTGEAALEDEAGPSSTGEAFENPGPPLSEEAAAASSSESAGPAEQTNWRPHGYESSPFHYGSGYSRANAGSMVGVGQPARYTGSVYHNIPQYLYLTGQYLSPQGHDTGHPLTDMQTYDYQLSGLPIVGFPMGAGPETVPHASSWEQCPLNTSSKESVESKLRQPGTAASV